MRTHDQEPVSQEARPPVGKRDENGESIASLALSERRPSALDTGAVLHLQRTAGNANVAGLLGEEHEEQRSPVKDVVGSGGGRPLDDSTREFMESRLGHDFSGVRIHTDSKATESAKAVQAHAYTVGNDVVFQSDRYAPETDAGKRMLAHELTHVVQQRSGPVAGTPAPGGIKISDPSDPFERAAEHNADQVMSAPPPNPATVPAPAPAVQRQAEEEEVQESPVQRQEEEEEEVQGAFVQRAEDEEEKKEEDEVQTCSAQRQEEEEERPEE